MIGRLIALVVCVVAVAGLYFLFQEAPPEQVDQELRLYEPGSYQGTPDAPLDESQKEELRSRVRNQDAI